MMPFQNIPRRRQAAMKAGTREELTTKNRFKDIIPCNYTYIIKNILYST